MILLEISPLSDWMNFITGFIGLILGGGLLALLQWYTNNRKSKQEEKLSAVQDFRPELLLRVKELEDKLDESKVREIELLKTLQEYAVENASLKAKIESLESKLDALEIRIAELIGITDKK